jgi:hypothetical protein
MPRFASAVLSAWLILVPCAVAYVALLAWGTAALSWQDIRQGVKSALRTSTLCSPLLWGLHFYVANSYLSVIDAAGIAAFTTLLSFPVFFAFLAVVPFKSLIRTAQDRGVPSRSVSVRWSANALLGVLTLCGLAVMSAFLLVAAPPFLRTM